MFWKRTLFWLYLIGLVLAYGSMARWYSFPGMVSYFGLATGQVVAGHAIISGLRKNALVEGPAEYGPDENTWDVRLSGGSFGHKTETIQVDQPIADQLKAQKLFHLGGRIPIVHVGGKWYPPREAKLHGLFGIPILSFMLLAVAALILRCAIGPRAFPERYEPASYDIGQSFNGLPTRRVIVLAAFLAVGFGLSIWQVFVGQLRLLHTDVGYWLGFVGDMLFLLAGPTALWASLPRLRRVRDL